MPIAPQSRPRRRSTRRVGALAVVASVAALGALGAGEDTFELPDPPAPPPGVVTWAELAPVVADRCVTCHASPGPIAELDLADAALVRRAIEERRLLTVIEDKEFPMPPSGRLPDATRALFHRWAAAGFPGGPDRTGEPRPADARPAEPRKEPPMVAPFDVSERGFEFLERMQGHWIGPVELMGQDTPWFAFDYRAIGPAHVYGLFEGGTVGNLMTSFFAARYRGVETIVARNGGVLNGFYRMSYFLLDRVERRGDATAYRFVDAIGGAGVMWMELTFEADRLEFVAYTSRMGEAPAPSRHMRFVATRRDTALAERAAEAHGFPDRAAPVDLPDGLPAPDWGDFGPVTSASYMWRDAALGYDTLARLAADPIPFERLGRLGRLDLRVARSPEIAGAKLLVYLSREPLTGPSGALRTRRGVVREDLLDGLLLFPEIVPSRDAMTFTHVHPGDCHLTVVADLDGDGLPGAADASGRSRAVTIRPGETVEIVVDDVAVR